MVPIICRGIHIPNSLTACSFPIIVRRYPHLSVPHRFLFLSRHFGTGVLLATAFVHLLPTAFVSLTDPCLPHFWNEGYPAMAGFVAMLSVLVVVGVEMFFATKGAGHAHGDECINMEEEGDKLIINEVAANGSLQVGKRAGGTRHFRHSSRGLLEDRDDTPDHFEDNFLPLHTRNTDTHDHAYDANNDDDSAADEDLPSSPGSSSRASLDGLANLDPTKPRRAHTMNGHGLDGAVVAPHSPPDPATIKRMILQCMLLEAGILFHSVFIGMAVSVATGAAFVVLLIAISFHQTFEGLALGSRIAAIPSFSVDSPKPWLMALAYGTTTPIGQAIGLVIHNLYDPASEGGLLMVGIMNSVSSGLLLFAGLVELLAEDFLKEESYVTLRGKKRLEACGAVIAGALLMALVGAWA